MSLFRSSHNLDFKSFKWHGQTLSDELSELFDIKNDIEYPEIKWKLYKIGTVEGQWRETPESFEILSIFNNVQGNGHLDDLFEWFEYFCRRYKKSLIIREFLNQQFKDYCINKRGFSDQGSYVEKSKLLMKSQNHEKNRN